MIKSYFYSAFGRQLFDPGSSKMTQTENQTKSKLRIFKSLWSNSNKPSISSHCSLFTDCVHVATSRTCEYLLFTDPDKKFQPSGAALCEIFLMTYMLCSFQLNLANPFSCTVMTQGQAVGTDQVSAVPDTPKICKTPKIQITVQVLHHSENTQENFEKHSSIDMEPFLGTIGGVLHWNWEELLCFVSLLWT